MAQQQTKLRMTMRGVSPLIMHNIRLANPLDPFAKAMKKVSSKRNKTEDDLEQMARLEFEGALYHSDSLGPVIPGANIERCIIEGARASKEGKKAETGVLIPDDQIPVLYRGPRDVQGLYENPNFVDTRAVRVGTARVMRTRPIFHEWEIVADVVIDPSIVDIESFQRWAENGGMLKGIGDHRPRYGRFTVEVEVL